MQDITNYLLTPTDAFGPLAILFFVVQIGALLAGIYLAFVRKDAHVLRGPALRRLGYALLALGAIGALLAGLRLGGVEPFTMRIWFYVTAVLYVALVVYAVIYRRTVYRQRAIELARSRGTRRAPASRAATNRVPTPPRILPPSKPANGESTLSGEPVAPQRGPAAPRRETRRERKRRKR